MAKRGRKPKKLPLKEALYYALLDTVDVVFYAGVPATGIVGFLEVLYTDLPELAKYGPYIAAGINVLYFFAKRAFEYYTGRRKPK